MRRAVLLLAALPLLFTPPVLAGHRDAPGPCPPPEVTYDYDVEGFTAHASLPVTGCAGREDTEFVLSATIARLDNSWGRDLVDRSSVCGPYRSAGDTESGDGRPGDACELSVTLDHPEVENAQYDVDVSYPGATGERTTSVFAFCTSDGKKASCDH